MHQIISGEILKKIEVFEKKAVDNFLESNQQLFNNLYSLKHDCLYDNKKIVNDHVLNYLNITENNPCGKELKKIIRREFDSCEKVYPFLGDLLIDLFYGNKKLKSPIPFKFKKQNQKSFLNSINHEVVKDIANLLFKNISLEYFIDIKKEKTDQVVVVKKNDLVFDIEFDFDYFQKYNQLSFEDYNLVIVDGIIDTMGDIHHLMYQAAENKEPYVIFCYGVSPEVKHTIQNNNSRGITKVFPIDIKVTEESLNILNDIAVINDDEVISALKGQTISQAIRKKLKKGKRIVIKKEKFILYQTCNDEILKSHKTFIQKRIDETDNDTNKKYLEKRLKRLSTKSITIFVPELLLKDNSFVRDLDYFLRFISNLSKKMVKIGNVNNKKFYYVPLPYIKLIKEKTKQLKITFNSIDKLVINRS